MIKLSITLLSTNAIRTITLPFVFIQTIPRKSKGEVFRTSICQTLCSFSDDDVMHSQYKQLVVSFFRVFVRFFGLDRAQNPTKTHFFRQDNLSKVFRNYSQLTCQPKTTKNKRLWTVTVDSKHHLRFHCSCCVICVPA